MKLRFSKTALGRFRFIALLEGVSFILLLFIAMPLKYKYGMPLAVKYIGWAHGVLFILYMIYLIRVKMSRDWSLGRTFIAFLASLFPFGTFIFDSSLQKEESTMIAAGMENNKS